MGFALLIFLMLLISSSSGNEYLFKGELPDDLYPFVRKKIGRDIYLLELPNRIKTLSYKGNALLEENHILRKLEIYPNDTCFNNQWGLEFINAPKAWDISTGSETVYVAVIDTGIDYNNPDIRTNLWKNPDEYCYNGQDDDNNGYVDDCYGLNVLCYPNGEYDPNAEGCNAPDALDDDGHGTHVAGIIGAVGNNGTLITGVLWRVKIIGCKFLDANGNGDIAGELECLNYIKHLKNDKGLNVVAINASYGNYYPDSQIQKAEISSLKDLNILYITAGGNDGANNEYRNFNPCNYDLDNEICVGAVGKDGNLAYFSNYGFYKVKVTSPGEDILSLKLGSYGNDCTSDLISYDGTSMATPFVTGAVALLLSRYPELSYSEIRNKMILSSRYNSSLEGKIYSCGVIDLYNLLSEQPVSKVCLSSTHVDFGSVGLCESSSRTLTVRNTGTEVVRLIGIHTDNKDFYLSENACNENLNPLQECTITIKFSPSSEGMVSGKLTLSFSNPELDREVNLVGRGLLTDNRTCASELSESNGGCSTGTSTLYSWLILWFVLVRIIKNKLLKE